MTLLPRYVDGAASDEADAALAMLQGSIPGVPGEDYPIYSEVPETAFSCDGQVDGGEAMFSELICNHFLSGLSCVLVHAQFVARRMWSIPPRIPFLRWLCFNKKHSTQLWPGAQKEIANGVKKRPPKSALAANAGQGRNRAVNQSCRAIPRPGASWWFTEVASGTDCDPATRWLTRS